jgi:hypothetical protein
MARHLVVGVIFTTLVVFTARSRAVEQARDDVSGLLERIGERVRSYYDRLTTIACTEAVTQVELKPNMSPFGKPHEFVYDVIVTREPTHSDDTDLPVHAERQIKSIDGRMVEKQDQPGCTDPKAHFDEPLAFLLPANRGRYRFTTGARGSASQGTVVGFTEIEAQRTTVTWKANCFTADGGRSTGQVWIDSGSGDIMRLETHLAEPFRIAAPRLALLPTPRTLIVEQSDTTVRFRRIPFVNPDETLLLPESIVTVTSVRGAEKPRLRTTQTVTNFRRFMTEAKVRGRP